DSDADALLSGWQQQCFLPHSLLQGKLLEGFVLMAIDEFLPSLNSALASYEEEMAPHREAALSNALRLGEACIAEEAWIAQQLEEGEGEEGEPKRLDWTDEKVWNLACEGSEDDSMARLFRILRDLYLDHVRLKLYEYDGKLQVQVVVTDDQIFPGWRLHMAVSGCAQLYRGMVVQFDDTSPPPLKHAFDSLGGVRACEDDPNAECGCRVVGLAKLKCLPYLQRTFGVRNLLPGKTEAPLLRLGKGGGVVR
ncbi:MAG: hypothetical protein SGPRY_015081, partial [Prymnesium sp.]